MAQNHTHERIEEVLDELLRGQGRIEGKVASLPTLEGRVGKNERGLAALRGGVKLGAFLLTAAVALGAVMAAAALAG